MRTPAVAGLLVVTLAAVSPTRSVESQGIGGLIKKKAAEAVKPKDAKQEPPKDDKKGDAPTESTFGDCGPLTPDKVSDFLRGLKAEKNSRDDFDSMISGLRTHEQVIACRNQEAMGGEVQKILSARNSIPDNATPAQVEKAMMKNMVDVEKHLLKKCGEDPSKFDKGKALDEARKAGLKASGLPEICYDMMKESSFQFCNLPAGDRQTAIEKGIRKPGYTATDAKALDSRCPELLDALKAVGYPDK